VRGSIAEATEHARDGRLDVAEAMCHDLLRANPRSPQALHLLGTLAHLSGRDDLATELISRAIVADPTEALYHADLGGLRHRSGLLVEAASSLGEALRLAPDLALANERLATVRAEQGHLQAAGDAARRALACTPDDVGMLSRLGSALFGAGARAAARECYERCLAIDPAHAEAHAGLGLLLLQAGELDSGWTEYEWRWRSVEMEAPRRLDAPGWTGEPLARRRMLLWAEQGLGDTLQFARYARLLAQRGAAVVLEVQPELERLMRDSLPEVDVVARGQAAPAFDLHAPLLSVPQLVQTRLATIPAEVPYLTATPECVAAWAERLGPRNGRRRVGLVWSGNRKTRYDRRAVDPAYLAPLANVPGVDWYSLQKSAAGLIPLDVIDRTAELADFADTAAVLMHLDLVITVDTAVAHLAGAVGRPVWILLAYAAEWRWLLERTDSPWYPTARLFRQDRPGDWAGVLHHMIQDLGQ
jgi:tetratricopeptide (TPR) repeat protein